MLKVRRPLGRLIFNMGIAIPGKTVFLIETAPSTQHYTTVYNIKMTSSSAASDNEFCQNNIPVSVCVCSNHPILAIYLPWFDRKPTPVIINKLSFDSKHFSNCVCGDSVKIVSRIGLTCKINAEMMRVTASISVDGTRTVASYWKASLLCTFMFITRHFFQ